MELCEDAELEGLVSAMQSAGDEGLSALEDALARFPRDPRLHFMRGSILAGQQKLNDAHSALQRAVELAPDYHLARYQLGFFELTSGEVDQALSSWGPLLRLPEDAYLRKFVEGLTFLVRDQFAEAISVLSEGLALNRENEPLNDDIRKIVAECRKLGTPGAEPSEAAEEERETSATSVMLGQYSGSKQH